VRRPYLVLLIIAGVVLFLAVSALLARVLSVDGAERSAITGLIQAEARGDASGLAARLQGCGKSVACQARVEEDAATLRHAGRVSIIQIQSSAGFALGSTLGTARVAWQAGGSLPIVQCVRVRRAGNALSGVHVQLLQLSRRIQSDADCPSRF
jgi:hypothetical protein